MVKWHLWGALAFVTAGAAASGPAYLPLIGPSPLAFQAVPKVAKVSEDSAMLSAQAMSRAGSSENAPGAETNTFATLPVLASLPSASILNPMTTTDTGTNAAAIATITNVFAEPIVVTMPPENAIVAQPVADDGMDSSQQISAKTLVDFFKIQIPSAGKTNATKTAILIPVFLPPRPPGNPAGNAPSSTSTYRSP